MFVSELWHLTFKVEKEQFTWQIQLLLPLVDIQDCGEKALLEEMKILVMDFFLVLKLVVN